MLPTKKEYLLTNYKPKKYQFIRAYTKMYPNFGVNFTQRSECYHAVIKRCVNRQISLADSLRHVKHHIQLIGENYNSDINRQGKKGPVLLDSVVFSKIKRLSTWYFLSERMLHNNLINISKTHKFLGLLATEWETTKKLEDLVESGEEEKVGLIVSNEGTYCPLLCELPLRWGFLYRHWMYPAFVDLIPIPSSLIHPRWFFDWSEHLTNTWKMSFDLTLPARTARLVIKTKNDITLSKECQAKNC